MVVRSGSVVTACVWVGNVFVLTSDLWNYICLSETPPTPRLAVSRFRRWLFPAVTAVILLTVIIILGASSKYACVFLLMPYVGTTAFGSLVRPNFCELHKQSCIMWFVALMPNDRKHWTSEAHFSMLVQIVTTWKVLQDSDLFSKSNNNTIIYYTFGLQLLGMKKQTTVTAHKANRNVVTVILS